MVISPCSYIYFDSILGVLQYFKSIKVYKPYLYLFIFKTPKLETSFLKNPLSRENSIRSGEHKVLRSISSCFEVIFVGILKYKVWWCQFQNCIQVFNVYEKKTDFNKSQRVLHQTFSNVKLPLYQCLVDDLRWKNSMNSWLL